MAEATTPKPISLEYAALGGINIKASEYSTGKAQFLDLRNVDFDIPNALQKRPGSSQIVTTGTSGPISSLFEFIKLDGSSYIVAGSDTAMFYLASNAYTLLSSGWNNGQPTDMLTFVNKLWMANGQKWESWGATGGVSAAPVGLPGPITNLFFDDYAGHNTGYGSFYVGGEPMWTIPSGPSYSIVNIYAAYSYLRSDGYMGPVNFVKDARGLVIVGSGFGAGTDYFGPISNTSWIGGFTIPSGYGISAIALWLASDKVTPSSPAGFLSGVGSIVQGDLGFVIPKGLGLGSTTGTYMSETLLPGALTSRFALFTLISGSSLHARQQAAVNGGATFWAIRMYLGVSYSFGSGGLAATYGTFAREPEASAAFSGMPFTFFNTFIPKYIEQSNNIMFASGASSSPSTVWFSEVGEPEFYQPDSNFEVRTNDGDRILALKEFQNQLMVFKETSFHKLVGDSADNFNLVQISNEFGCLSNRCVIPFGNDLLFLDKKGIVKYNGASWDVISSPVESAFRRMNIDAAREKATAVNNTYRNQVWFAIPVDGSTENNLTVVYDYLVQAWTFFDGYNPSAYAAVRGQLTQPTAWRGDYSGLIHFTGSSFYSDSGRAITCLTFSRFDKMQGENETSIWRRYFLDVAPVSGATTPIQGQVFSDYNHSTVQATFSIYQTLFQSRAEMGVVGKAVAIQLSHASASLPLLINGYALAKRGLRNV